MAKAPDVGPAPLWLAPVVFCGMAAVFLSFGSNDFTLVDGALRCLEPFRGSGTLLHGNNHLLYPLWIFGWIHLVGGLGVSVATATDIIHATQALNGLLAAASISLLYSILSKLTDYRMAIACSLVHGLSTSMLLHATSSAEPLPGFFFAVLGLWTLVAALSGSSSSVAFLVSGICFALAMASYQAMATVAVLGAFVITRGAGLVAPGAGHRRAASQLAWVTAGGLLGVAVIYGSAYAAQGVALGDMPARFMALGGSPAVYSGFSVARAVNLPLGLIENSYDGLPANYTGLRALVGRGDAWTSIPVIGVGLVMWAIAALLTSDGWRRLAATSPRGTIACALATLVAMVCPLLYWDPLYDKLWLLPLAVLMIAIGVALRPDALDAARRRWLVGLVTGLAALELLGNLPDVAARHARPTPYLPEASAVASLVRPTDAVVLDFDPTSSLWHAMFHDDQRVLRLPSATRAEAEAWLEAVERDSGVARIVFVGVLDQDRDTWNGFLGGRVGIPYELLARHRARSLVLQTFDTPRGRLTVRAFDPVGKAQ